jgi:hypothetical protein
MGKKLKILFTLEEWASHEIISCFPTTKANPEAFGSGPFRKKVEEENKEKEIVSAFLAAQRLKFKEVKEEIEKNRYRSEKKYEELIEMPKTKHFYERVIRTIENCTNTRIYESLLEHNGIPCYYSIFRNITSDYTNRRRIFVPVNTHNGQDYILDILRHAMMLAKPAVLQDTMEYVAEQFEELIKIDSKEKTKEAADVMWSELHKSFRQTDPLGNGHAEGIVHNLMYLSDVPYQAIKAVIEHVKKKEYEGIL